jgi:hypothetical protein
MFLEGNVVGKIIREVLGIEKKRKIEVVRKKTPSIQSLSEKSIEDKNK